MFDNRYKDRITDLEQKNSQLIHQNKVQNHKLNHKINSLKSNAQSFDSKYHNAIKHANHIDSKMDDLKNQISDLKGQVKDAHTIPISNFNKYYVIYNGLDFSCCVDHAESENPIARPTFWVNDVNDFHTGTINYDHDLIRKIFTKNDLDMFYRAFTKHFDNPRNLVKQLERNTMTLKQAKNDRLILTSDYTKSYSGHVLKERIQLHEVMRNENNNDMLCPSDIGTI